MVRTAYEHLKKWKERKTRRPMILRGPRQVGKTWLLREFGEKEYECSVYINFEENTQIASLFSGPPSVDRIITGLGLCAGHSIDPASTLLIFDEIQAVPQALSCLKTFSKDAPEFHILCASSGLDAALRAGAAFPAEWVEVFDLHPMSFFEFLLAAGKESYVTMLRERRYDLTPSYRQDYIRFLKYYCFVGGMPEAVAAFSERRDFSAAREAQRRILTVYEQGFSKSAPAEALPRIRMLWNSIPRQLDRDNRKFIFGAMKEGARARDFETALAWLTDNGLVRDIHRASLPESPLEASEDVRAFKLFLPDVGLLGCLLGLRQDTLLDGNAVFWAYHGALTEQYVLQQLDSLNQMVVCYWVAERGTAEVEFLVDNCMDAIPVEIAVEQNLQSKKLKVFREKFHPKQSIRTSLSDYRREPGLLNLPLWALETL